MVDQAKANRKAWPCDGATFARSQSFNKFMPAVQCNAGKQRWYSIWGITLSRWSELNSTDSIRKICVLHQVRVMWN
jgi:hypothetical protein